MIARMGYWASLFGGGGGRDNYRDRGGGFVALLMLIVAPIAATLIQLAVSRSREYEADASGAKYTGNPYALASALKKLDAYSKRVPMQATPSTAHLFIVALSGREFFQPVLDASADCQADREADGAPGGYGGIMDRFPASNPVGGVSELLLSEALRLVEVTLRK